MYERSNRGSYSKTISIRQVQYVLYRKPYMIYSPFYIKYLYLNILSAASVPRPHSTSNLLSTCHVLAWGSGPSKQTWPLAPCPDCCSVGAFAGWLVQCGIVGTIFYAIFSCIPDCLVWGIQELCRDLSRCCVHRENRLFLLLWCAVLLVGSLGWLWQELTESRGWAEASKAPPQCWPCAEA